MRRVNVYDHADGQMKIMDLPEEVHQLLEEALAARKRRAARYAAAARRDGENVTVDEFLGWLDRTEYLITRRPDGTFHVKPE